MMRDKGPGSECKGAPRTPETWMVTARINLAGLRATIERAGFPTHDAALEWTRGYLKPGPVVPVGSTVDIDGRAYIIDPMRRNVRPLGE